MDGRLRISDWIGLCAVAVALAAIMLTGQYQTNHRLDRLEDRMNTGFDNVGTELRKLGERVARIEGVIAGPPPLPTEKHAAPSGK